MATHLYRMGTGNGGGDEPTGKLIVTGEVGSVCHVLDIDTGVELSSKEFIGNTVSFIVEADKVYEVWMTKTDKESAHVTTDPIAQLTTRISLKYYTAYIDIYCDADAKLSATNGTATFGEGSYRYDGAKFIMTVGETGTYTITATIEKASVITTGISVVEDSHVTATMPSFGRVKLNASSDFATPLAITCTKKGESTPYDAKTYTGTDVTFVFAEAETYVFDAVAKDGEHYPMEIKVVLGSTISKTLETMIDVEFNIYSAVKDTVTIKREDGSEVGTCVTDATGKGTVTFAIKPSGETIEFVSSVAKAIGGSDDYSKSILLTEDNTEVYVMPDTTIFWYGNYVNAKKVEQTVLVSAGNTKYGTMVGIVGTIIASDATKVKTDATGTGVSVKLSPTDTISYLENGYVAYNGYPFVYAGAQIKGAVAYITGNTSEQSYSASSYYTSQATSTWAGVDCSMHYIYIEE